MVKRRIRTGLYSQITVPAPRGLVNTAIAPQTLPSNFAQYMENMLPDVGAANAIAKRFGSATLGDAIGAGNITELMEYRKSDGTTEILAYTDDGKIHVLDESAGTWSTLKSGLTTTGTIFWTVFNDQLVIVNGIDDNMVYDGSTITDMSEYVKETLGVDWSDEDEVTIPVSTDKTARYPASRNLKVRFKGKNLAISSITRASTTATVTTSVDHNLETGDYVTIANAAQDEYNGRVEITSTGTNTFTYTVSGSPATPATVTTARIKSVKGTGRPTTAESQIAKKDGVYTTSALATGFRVYFQTPYIFGDPAAQLGNVKVQYRASGGAWIEVTPVIKRNGDFWQLRAEVQDLDQGTYDIRVIEAGEYTAYSSDLSSDEKRKLGLLTDNGQSVPYEKEFTNVTMAVYENAFTGNEVVSTGLTATNNDVVELSSLTHSSGTATATTVSNHPYQTGDFVTIYDVDETEYAGTWEVTRATSTTFTFAIPGNPTSPASASGSLPTTLVYSFDELEKTTTVSSSSFSSETITVTFNDAVMPAADVTIVDLEYEDTPRPFGFIFAQHDRLWALEGGELKATEFKANNRTKVYYTNIRDAVNSWFNEDTQAESFIDIGRKFNGNDELVGIGAIDGSMAFFGRNQTQIWAGTTPTLGGDLSWVKSLPIGCVHGKLIQNFPRDILFFTPYGPRSLRTVFQTEQLEITPDLGSNIDPTVQTAIDNLLASDASYKKARSWLYSRDGFYGFRLDDKGPLVYALTEEARGWTKFTGLFKDSTAYLGLTDGRLVYAKNDQLYVYTNGANGTATDFSDNDVAYRAAWWTPWFERRSRWNNRYIELIFENSGGSLGLVVNRYKDQDNTSAKQLTETVSPGAAFWDEALWDVANWDSRDLRVVLRDKYLANSFSYLIETNDTQGPFRLSGLIIHGGR